MAQRSVIPGGVNQSYIEKAALASSTAGPTVVKAAFSISATPTVLVKPNSNSRIQPNACINAVGDGQDKINGVVGCGTPGRTYPPTPTPTPPPPPTTRVIYLHSDHIGSASVVTDSNGAVLSQQDFDPWGSIRTGLYPTGTIGQTDVNYTGQVLDGSGLLYYHARYYDPFTSRFVSPDSIVPSGSNPQSFNRYSYVGNNPLIHTDPSGHYWREATTGEKQLFNDGGGGGIVAEALITNAYNDATGHNAQSATTTFISGKRKGQTAGETDIVDTTNKVYFEVKPDDSADSGKQITSGENQLNKDDVYLQTGRDDIETRLDDTGELVTPDAAWHRGETSEFRPVLQNFTTDDGSQFLLFADLSQPGLILYKWLIWVPDPPQSPPPPSPTPPALPPPSPTPPLLPGPIAARKL